MLAFPNQSHRIVLSWKPCLMRSQVVQGFVKVMSDPAFQCWKDKGEKSNEQVAESHVKEREWDSKDKPTTWAALNLSFRYKKGCSPWKVVLLHDRKQDRTEMSWTWHESLATEHNIKQVLLCVLGLNPDTLSQTPGFSKLQLVRLESRKDPNKNPMVEWGQSLFWDGVVPCLTAPQQLWSQWVAKKVPICGEQSQPRIPDLGLTCMWNMHWLSSAAARNNCEVHDVLLGGILASLFELQPERIEMSVSLRLQDAVWAVMMCNRAPSARGMPWPYLVCKARKEILVQRHSGHMQKLGQFFHSFHSVVSWTSPKLAQSLQLLVCPGAHISYGAFDLGSNVLFKWDKSTLMEASYVPPAPLPDQYIGISFGACAYMGSVRLSWINFEDLPAFARHLHSHLMSLIHMHHM